MKILITGATGLVGSEVLRQAIADDAITAITCLARKQPDIDHPKIVTVLHRDFTTYTDLSHLFRQQDACIWCLGISQSQVNREQYHIITYDYTVAAAQAMLQAHPGITFLFISGMGADNTEKSRTLFARVKGKTENALKKMGFEKLYLVRPGGIQPVHINKNTAFLNKLMIPLFPLLRLLMPSMIINSVELAKVILHIIKNGDNRQVLENKDLLAVYKQKVLPVRREDGKF